MSDLIERLRKVRLYPDYDFTHLYYVDTEKSVDDQLDADFVHYDDAATALAEAQAEIARLKDVLEIVAAGPILGEPMARWINHMMVKARAALARPHDAAEGEAG